MIAKTTRPNKVRLGFLTSGRGSNMIAIIENCKTGYLHAGPAVVISNNADTDALKYACDEGIPAFHLSTQTNPENLDDVIVDTLKSQAVDWIILAGYMKKIGSQLLKEFENRIFNIHPSLLPEYGGKGMYGLHVHKAVLISDDVETGVTIHLVNNEYDRGRILAQRSVTVQEGDTPELLAARVLKVEHELYTDTLQDVIEGRISL